MASNKKQIFILLGLVLVLALLWLRQLLPRQEAVKNLSLVSDASLESVRQFEKILKNFYNADTSMALLQDTIWLNVEPLPAIRNPFAIVTPPVPQPTTSPKRQLAQRPAPKPVVIKPKPLPVFKLGGIIYERNRPHAIINATVVQVGDTLEGFRIVEITPFSVGLANERGTILLNLPEDK